MDLEQRNTSKKLVVVGNGMVSYRLCQRLVEGAPQPYAITVIGEEPIPAYDRVGLTNYFASKSADSLILAGRDWYSDHGIELVTGKRVARIDRANKTVQCVSVPARGAVDSSAGTSQAGGQETNSTLAYETLAYDILVLCTGSAPFVPPIPGRERPGVFVYRTIDDLDAIIQYSVSTESAVVLGGGLLGLEAARAVQECGLRTHVVELAPRLMPRQLDDSGARLLTRSVEELGVEVHVGAATKAIVGRSTSEHDDRNTAPPTTPVAGIELDGGSFIDAGMVVISAGIRPRDELARDAGLDVGPRGGIAVDDGMATSDPSIFAIGECALHRNTIYGLVAPCYEMADVLARKLTGQDDAFEGADCSSKLKLLGTDVASFGDPFADGEDIRTIVYQDLVKGIYKKLVLSHKGTRLAGGVLVGDSTEYATLVHAARTQTELPEHPEELILGAKSASAPGALPDEVQICSCNAVSKADICQALREQELSTVGEVKSCTKAGTGCGGCLPLVTDIVNAELKALGKAKKPRLCEHFAHTRQELFEIISVTGISSFEELIERYGNGAGCEICKPTVASIFASTHNDMILNHATLQDTNDRFLANIQRQGLYSVVPRVPGGEITPEKLIVLGQVAKKYGLYTKITGGQRIDLFGARLNQLPDIWEELIDAGFESGHAYGKALRTVKSCVGTSWCRYGVQDSTAFAIRVENRYKGLRAPHKLKGAASGCIRECAEAQSKDFGLIATEKGWNLYVCGNGGAKPRHADLLAADVDEETCVKYLDRFLMFYISTADKLTRTAAWLEKLEGGIEHLRDVVVHDSLGIADELEQKMQRLVDTYACEWTAVVRNPERRAQFRHFANSSAHDTTVQLVEERGQTRPSPWDQDSEAQNQVQDSSREKRKLPVVDLAADTEWVPCARVEDVPENGGISVQYGDTQIAVYNFNSRGSWYATQNSCPHRHDMVLARGILGTHNDTPKVACPLHKKTFSLESGECLSGEEYEISTFPVKVENGRVYVQLPPPSALADMDRDAFGSRCDVSALQQTAAE